MKDRWALLHDFRKRYLSERKANHAKPDLTIFLVMQPATRFNMNEPTVCAAWRKNEKEPVLRKHIFLGKPGGEPEGSRDVKHISELVNALEETLINSEKHRAAMESVINCMMKGVIQRWKEAVRMAENHIYFVNFNRPSLITSLHLCCKEYSDVFDLEASGVASDQHIWATATAECYCLWFTFKLQII